MDLIVLLKLRCYKVTTYALFYHLGVLVPSSAFIEHDYDFSALFYWCVLHVFMLSKWSLYSSYRAEEYFMDLLHLGSYILYLTAGKTSSIIFFKLFEEADLNYYFSIVMHTPVKSVCRLWIHDEFDGSYINTHQYISLVQHRSYYLKQVTAGRLLDRENEDLE